MNKEAFRISQSRFDDGLTSLTTKSDQYQTGMNFTVLKLRADGCYHISQTECETAILLMSGHLYFQFGENASYHAFRTSYFNEDPFVLHAAKGETIQLQALTDCECFIIQCDNEKTFPTMFFDTNNLLESENRGAGLLDDVSHRIVRTVFDKRNRIDANLVLGEIISFSGKWSSCPPHTHPQPEIYHYRFSEPQGFAFAEVGEDAIKVQHNDTLIITDERAHAHACHPGYALYTLWFIRHLPGNPYIVPSFQQPHAFAKSTSANQRVWRQLEY